MGSYKRLWGAGDGVFKQTGSAQRVRGVEGRMRARAEAVKGGVWVGTDECSKTKAAASCACWALTVESDVMRSRARNEQEAELREECRACLWMLSLCRVCVLVGSAVVTVTEVGGAIGMVSEALSAVMQRVRGAIRRCKQRELSSATSSLSALCRVGRPVPPPACGEAIMLPGGACSSAPHCDSRTAIHRQRPLRRCASRLLRPSYDLDLSRNAKAQMTGTTPTPLLARGFPLAFRAVTPCLAQEHLQASAPALPIPAVLFVRLPHLTTRDTMAGIASISFDNATTLLKTIEPTPLRIYSLSFTSYVI
jgi:hypothetical protein